VYYPNLQSFVKRKYCVCQISKALDYRAFPLLVKIEGQGVCFNDYTVLCGKLLFYCLCPIIVRKICRDYKDANYRNGLKKGDRQTLSLIHNKFSCDVNKTGMKPFF
jgi:hypothetical protein